VCPFAAARTIVANRPIEAYPARMSRTKAGLGALMTMLLVGCGGSRPEAADASNAADDESHEKASADSDEKSDMADKGDDDKSAGSSKDDGAKKDDGDKKSDDPTRDDSGGPAFPENASVAQAIAAVPKGTQRSNIDPETLAEPLNKPELYAPCKAGSQHFKLKVAVWNGKAVGMDVTSSNKALAECVKKQVWSIEWRDKVKSLNTVEYSM
jgi:hypothetical protein